MFCSATQVHFAPNYGDNVFYAEDIAKKRLIFAFVEAKSEKDAAEDARELLRNYYHNEE